MSQAAQSVPHPRSGCLHLPVAGQSNFRRRFGAPAAPGRALGLGDVAQWMDRVLADGVWPTGIGVSGPGEPLADPLVTLEALRTARKKFPDLPLFLVTSGLCPQGADIVALAGEFAAAGLARATLLVDAVDPAVVEQIFAWIRPGRRTVPLPEAASYFVDAQARAVKSFREVGVAVTVRMTIYPGINDFHVEDVANVAAMLGAEAFDVRVYVRPDRSACAPKPSSSCSPSACASCGLAGTCGPAAAPDPTNPDEDAPELAELAPGRLEELQRAAARHIRLIAPDACDADIRWTEGDAALGAGGPLLPRPSGERVNVAVASSGGLDVDLHLGQALRFLIYGPRAEDGLHCLLGTRDAPEPGGGDRRWVELADTLRDCFALLVASAGARPREILAQRGIAVLATETDVAAAVDALFGGGARRRKRVKVE